MKAIHERTFVFTTNVVIPARDAGIQEFYQVGEHKSYVKMHHFYGNWIPVSSTGMTRKGGIEMTKKGYLDDNEGLHTLLVGSNHSVHAVVSDTGWAVLTTSPYIF
jgi:hypothetical protein